MKKETIDLAFHWLLALLILAGLGSIVFHPSEGTQSHSHPPALPPTPTPVCYRSHFVFGETFRGEASWYSREHCLGCNPRRIMSNGQPLDDNKPTIAMNRLPLGTLVEITNMKNGKVTLAIVTGRGGFEKLGRIADFTPRVRDSLGCRGTCRDVKIRVVKRIELLPCDGLLIK